MKFGVTTEAGDFFPFEVDRECDVRFATGLHITTRTKGCIIHPLKGPLAWAAVGFGVGGAMSTVFQLSQLKALIENEVILLNGQDLGTANKSLHEHGVRDHDMLLVRRRSGASGRGNMSSGQQPGPVSPGGEHPEAIRQQLLSNPAALAQLRQRNSAVADAVHDPERFAQVIRQQMEAELARRREHAEVLRRLETDPFDIEAQRLLEESIRLQNVNNSLEQAMEYAPETFGRVFMLYINCEVNGHKVKAFVDSGAQMTIMSSGFAEKCGLSWFMDTRWTGTAKGVGSARILGRVHMSPLKIEGAVLPCSFTILEEQSVDLLLGLDMLRRHQAVIDLKDNVLRIGGVEAKFLGEADLPANARDHPEELAEAEHLANSAASKAHRISDQASASTPAVKSSAGASAPPPTSSPAAPSPVPGTSSGQPAMLGTTSTTVGVSEESIQALMALGASRDQAVGALRIANGNVDLAAGLLF